MSKVSKKSKTLKRRNNEGEATLEEGLREIVVDALRKPNSDDSGSEPGSQDWDGLGNVKSRIIGNGVDLLIAYDPLYHVSLMYAWGPHELYKSLVSELFPNPGSISGPADGLCIFGGLKNEVGGMTGALVWVNNKIPKKLSAATWAHEITHVSQDVLHHVGVNDSSGEAQAYYVGREVGRILKSFLGIDSEFNRLPDKLGRLCAKVDGIMNNLEGPKETK